MLQDNQKNGLGKFYFLREGKNIPLAHSPDPLRSLRKTGFYTVDENSGARSKLLRKIPD